LNEEEAHVGSAGLKTKRFDFSGKVVEVLRSQYSPPASMRFDFRAHFTPSSSINLLPLPPCTPSRSPAKTSPPEEPHTTVGMLADQAQSVQAQKTNARQQQQQQQEREEGGEYKVETEHAEWVAQDLKITEMEGREKEATGERWERDASGREEMVEKQKEDTRKEREKKEREMEDTQNEERRQKEHVSASEVDTLVVGKQEEGVGHESCGTLPTCELLPPPRPADADKECVQGDASAGSKSLGQKRRFDDSCTMEGDERDSKKSKDSDNEVSEKEGDTQDEGALAMRKKEQDAMAQVDHNTADHGQSLAIGDKFSSAGGVTQEHQLPQECVLDALATESSAVSTAKMGVEPDTPNEQQQPTHGHSKKGEKKDREEEEEEEKDDAESGDTRHSTLTYVFFACICVCMHSSHAVVVPYSHTCTMCSVSYNLIKGGYTV